ncbi:DUF397 domain-containing protein [Kitasatospora cineracea]
MSETGKPHPGGFTRNVRSAAENAAHGLVPVRDSKDPHGPALLFAEAAFAAFVTAVKSGRLDMG